MSAATFIFPHQLFKKHSAVKQEQTIYLIEEELFFHQYNFHQKKILLHRASMQYYKEFLEKKGFKVVYVEAASKQNSIATIVESLLASIKEIHYAELTDDWLQSLKVANGHTMRRIV